MHRLDARAKLAVTLAFIVTVVSFDKYAVSALIPFLVFPMMTILFGGLPAGYILKRVVIVAPFAILVGVFNPVIDRSVVFSIGSLSVSAGWLSFVSIILRFILTVSAAVTLIAVTGFYQVCTALEWLKVPRPFIVQLMFLYRYLFVLTDEFERMLKAIAVRSFSGKSMRFGTYVPVAGHLLLRTLGRADRIYRAMCCRGFDGHMRSVGSPVINRRDMCFTFFWAVIFLALRFINVAEHAGRFVARAF